MKGAVSRLQSIVSTDVARVTAVNTLVIQINGTIDQLESIIESTVNGSEAQVQQVVKETIFVLKNLSNNLEPN
jgi:thymidine phosphorylase